MKTYINSDNGNYALEADEGKILYNPKTEQYTYLIANIKDTTITDWTEVDAPTSEIVVLDDSELLDQFRSDIDSHVTIKRDTKADTDTSVDYTFSYSLTSGCVITETFS